MRENFYRRVAESAESAEFLKGFLRALCDPLRLCGEFLYGEFLVRNFAQHSAHRVRQLRRQCRYIRRAFAG
jgi:hypothetical protein